MGIIKNKHTDKHTGELEIVKSSLILFTVLLFFLLADYVSAAEFPYCLQKYSENGNGFWDGWLLLDNWATLPGNIGTQDHNSGGISPLLTIPGRGKKISATYDIKFATEDDFEPGPSGYGRRVGGGGHFASVISRSHNWCPEGTSCNDGRSCYDKWLRLELTSPTEEGYGISVRNHGPDYDQFCQSNSFGKVPGMRLRAGQWIRIRHEGEITGTNSARLTLQYISIDGTPLVGSQYTKVWNCNFVNPVPILHFYSFGNYDRGTQSGATYGDLQTRNLQFSVENSGEPPQSCSDGTPYNQCSSNKPRYCSNGNLISSCGPPNNCGCPSQQVCNQDGTCGAAQIPRCDQQGGICCTSGQTCNGNSVASNNCNTLCCVGTCQSPTQSILFEDDFESYSVGTTPSLWSSDQGTWTVEYETQGGNKVYKSYSTDAWLYSWPNNANFLNENNYEIIAKLNRWGGSASTGLGIIGYFNPSTGDGYIIRFRNVSPYTWIEKVDNFSTLTTISTYNFVPPSAAWFNVKAQFETLSDKTVIKLKVWNQGATEPVSWNLATNDTSRYSTQGTFGFAHRYNTEWYDDFEVSSIQQGSNRPPTATITLPTQTSFIINTQINYNGQGSDPENQPLTYTWTYDIIGDTSPEFPLPPGQSGTFTPTILVRNQSTLYTLKLVVRDTQGATGTAMKNLTINPVISSDLIISDITEKQVISFNLNSSIPFSGRGIDPDGELSGNQLVWSYDIIGDNQGIIRIGSGNSGSFIADKSTGELTIYKLFLNASDGKLSDIDFKEILIKLVNIPTDRRCSDGTPINQCSADMPLYCDNGNLVSRCGSPENCGCPDNQRCKRNGTCGGPNRLPRANLIEPTQNLFGNNASIGYLGNGTDEDQGNLISSELI